MATFGFEAGGSPARAEAVEPQARSIRRNERRIVFTSAFAAELVIHVTGADARLQALARESPAPASCHGAGALLCGY
jgi:hypothetical protein